MARFFCIFHALSFELNFFFDRRFPLTESPDHVLYCWIWLDLSEVMDFLTPFSLSSDFN